MAVRVSSDCSIFLFISNVTCLPALFASSFSSISSKCSDRRIFHFDFRYQYLSEQFQEFYQICHGFFYDFPPYCRVRRLSIVADTPFPESKWHPLTITRFNKVQVISSVQGSCLEAIIYRYFNMN